MLPPKNAKKSLKAEKKRSTFLNTELVENSKNFLVILNTSR